MAKYKVISFYKYVSIGDPEAFVKEHLQWCIENGIKGKVYVATEGISGAIFAVKEKTELYKSHLRTYKLFNDMWFKETETDKIAYSQMHVRVKKEIVNSGGLNVNLRRSGKKLSPESLLRFYKEGKDFVMVDVRNWYESEIGKFKNAVTPAMTHFREWPQVVVSLKEYKNKTVVTYCTGGIRCEKASAYMIEEGFEDVYQLDGGIINFINQHPDTYWQGGMFVFDDRKVVEPNSKEELKYVAECEFCGKPTSYFINCHNVDCDRIVIICQNCKVDKDYCCSDECRKAENKRDSYYD
jgi:UPF0176 protein